MSGATLVLLKLPRLSRGMPARAQFTAHLSPLWCTVAVLWVLGMSDRPYKLHTTTGAEGTRLFMEWLQKVGANDADPVGVAEEMDGIALAQEEDVYVLEPGPEDDFGRAALAAALMGSSPPRLVAVDAEQTLVSLSEVLRGHYPPDDFFRRLSACMVGDLKGCAYVSGHAAIGWDNLSVADAAYTARLLEPQYKFEAAPFYTAISLPLARLKAEWRMFGWEKPADWWVAYPRLWVRSLAHYTTDPTLTWLFNEGQDPLEGLARLLEWPLERTEAVLVWHVCGRSVDVMAKVAPALMEHLPDDLPAVGDAWNRRFPNLWLGITNIMNTYSESRTAHTRYGRKQGSGLHPGEASAFTIFGTVQDILDVLAVTLWNNRPHNEIMIKRVDHSALEPTLRVIGVGPAGALEQEKWIQTVGELATLASPLGSMPLMPTVVQSPEPPEAQASVASIKGSGGSTGTIQETTTLAQTRGGNSLSGKSRSTAPRRQTKPKGSGAGRRRASRARAAKQT